MSASTAQGLIHTDTNRLPMNVQAEKAVIGAVLINPDVFPEVSLVIPEGKNEFWVERHQWIWNAFEVLRMNLQPIDLLTVEAKLRSMELLGEIGGVAYLTELVNSTPASYNAAAHAQIVHDCFVRRRMIETASVIASMAYDPETNLDELKSGAMQRVSNTVALGDSLHLVSFADSVEEVTRTTYERARTDALPGIPTGWVDLDRMLDGGWQDGALYLIANRPGGGKTSLLTQTAAHAASLGKRVLIFSLEMPRKQITARIISQQLEVSGRGIKTGRLSQSEWRTLETQTRGLRGLDIVIDDTPGLTPEQMLAKCEVVAEQGGLDLIVLDYLALMTSKTRFTKRVEEIDYFARTCKIAARQFNVPFLAAQQMNRSIETRAADAEPQLADLNEGGEKDSDTVIFIHHKKRGEVIDSSFLKVAKNRDGETGIIPIVFRGEFTRFESAARIQE